MNCNSRRKDFGILGMSAYVPSQYVDQGEFEKYSGVLAGNYTIGLGQTKMAFCGDREDVVSISMTAVDKLMKTYNVNYGDIGRLDVGTESLIDKCKSVKSYLMALFEESGNFDVEGVDNINACYGGTAALFNAVNWLESSAWDGRRLALVVMADIAVYNPGNARCTGGVGAVAVLVGPNAAILLENGSKVSYMAHAYDFYKPDMSSEYPLVDGSLSIKCYYEALLGCYRNYKADSSPIQSNDAVLMHCPFSKLVVKSLALLYFYDNRDNLPPNFQSLEVDSSAFTTSKEVEKYYVKASASLFDAKSAPGLMFNKIIGNSYTASLYVSLISQISQWSCLAGKTILMFSYGSGYTSSMFRLKFSDDESVSEKLKESVKDFASMLESRQKISPIEYTEVMLQREKAYDKFPYDPVHSVDSIGEGVWYLSAVDDKGRRSYRRKN